MTLAFLDNHHAAVTIPAGSIVDVKGPAADDRFCVVEVGGEELLIFAADLDYRGKPVKEDHKSARAASNS
jgi:hypothetical protein